MREIFQCGDSGALVTYLYDECTPEERETIAAHLSQCIACAGEISGLASTRRALAQWAPPEIDLGLQITRKADEAIAAPPGSVLAFRRPQHESLDTPAPWWKSPLPAWAQVAAALVIFAAGLSVGFMRDGGRAAAPTQAATTVAPAPVPVSTGASKSDLAELEQRLRADMTQLARSNSTPQPQPVPVAMRSNDDAMMQRVQTLLEEQRIDFTERMVRQQGEFEARRRADLETMGTRVGQIGTELRQHRQAIDGIAVRVSQPR